MSQFGEILPSMSFENKGCLPFKIIFISIFLCLFLLTVPNVAGESSWMVEPEWCEHEETYLVSSLGELNWMRNDLRAEYVLVDDINAEETKYWNDGKGWEPVGDIEDEFKGILDGQGYQIRNLHIDRPEEKRVGLIGFNKGLVKNLGLMNVDVVGEDTVSGLVAEQLRGEIIESYSTGRVEGEHYVGGLVAKHKSGSLVEKCYSLAEVEGGEGGVGGLVGWMDGSTVSESYSDGEVINNELDFYGGLIGNSPDGTIEDVANSYWDDSTTRYSDEGENLSTRQMTGIDAKTNMDGFDFEETWITVEDGEEIKEAGYPILEHNVEGQLIAQNLYDNDYFEVNIIGIDDYVEKGEEIEIVVNVKNIGELEGVQDIYLKDFEGEKVYSKEDLILGSGDSEEFSMTWDTSDVSDNSGRIKVGSEDEEKSRKITFEEDSEDENIEDGEDSEYERDSVTYRVVQSYLIPILASSNFFNLMGF